MKYILTTLYILFKVVYPSNYSYAQDPIISQFYAQPLYIAPSFAGLNDATRVILNYRNQWPSISNTFVTNIVSFDQYFPDINSGVGILFVNDQIGGRKLTKSALGVQYAYNTKVGEGIYIRPGIELSVNQGNLNTASLIFGDQINNQGHIIDESIETFDAENRVFIDASTSALLYSQQYWFGVALKHLVKSKQSTLDVEDELPIRYSVLGGWTHHLSSRRHGYNSNSNISFAFIYWQQEKYNQLSLGSYYNHNNIDVGIWYRGIPVNNTKESLISSEAMILIFGYSWTNVRVSYSYDFTISSLGSTTGGAHEIVLTYNFRPNENKKKRLPIPCPSHNFGRNKYLDTRRNNFRR